MPPKSLPNQTLKWCPISLPKWEHFWTNMKRINKSRLSWSKLLANFRVSCFRPDPSRRPWRPSHPTMRKGIKYLANSITTSFLWCHRSHRLQIETTVSSVREDWRGCYRSALLNHACKQTAFSAAHTFSDLTGVLCHFYLQLKIFTQGICQEWCPFWKCRYWHRLCGHQEGVQEARRQARPLLHELPGCLQVQVNHGGENTWLALYRPPTKITSETLTMI